MTTIQVGDEVVTQRDVDGGTEFYCLCHGWRRPESLNDLCPNTYASCAPKEG